MVTLFYFHYGVELLLNKKINFVRTILIVCDACMRACVLELESGWIECVLKKSQQLQICHNYSCN